MRTDRTGWIFRAYPGPYKAYLETPAGKCELIKVYEKGQVPKLRDVSGLIREESQVRVHFARRRASIHRRGFSLIVNGSSISYSYQARGYAILNDRYLSPRL